MSYTMLSERQFYDWVFKHHKSMETAKTQEEAMNHGEAAKSVAILSLAHAMYRIAAALETTNEQKRYRR